MDRWTSDDLFGRSAGPWKGLRWSPVCFVGRCGSSGQQIELGETAQQAGSGLGPLCSQTPLLSGILDCHAPQGCTCSLPSGVRHPGSSQMDCDSPFLLVKGPRGLFWARASLGSWASAVLGVLLWGSCPPCPRAPCSPLSPCCGHSLEAALAPFVPEHIPHPRQTWIALASRISSPILPLGRPAEEGAGPHLTFPLPSS